MIKKISFACSLLEWLFRQCLIHNRAATVALFASLFVLASAPPAVVSGQDVMSDFTLVRTVPINESMGARSAGILFLTDEAITSLDNLDAASPTASDKSFLIYSLLARSDDLMTIPASIPTASEVLYDPVHDSLVLFDLETGSLMSVANFLGPLQPQEPQILRNRSELLGIDAPVDMALDPVNNRVFLLDATARIVVVELNDDEAAEIDLSQLGIVSIGAVAFNPQSGHLFIADTDGQTLYEITESGLLIQTYDLTSLDLGTVQGMSFAPSADRTDSANELHLFIYGSTAPSQVSSANTRVDSSIRPQTYIPFFSGNRVIGPSLSVPEVDSQASTPIMDRIYAIDITPRLQTVRAAMVMAGTLEVVQQIDTTTYPSSDPAGVKYHPGLNKLFISDSEVNETPTFAGYNLYTTPLGGQLISTTNSSAYSMELTSYLSYTVTFEEPNGVAYNPSNGHIFYSDDDDDMIVEIDPGPDGQLGTSDDVATAFDTRAFGSMDPEGIAYDSQTPGLFICDGDNEEVYHVLPGPNGLFDGVDDIYSSFDTTVNGIKDPEGIDYDPATGNLFITSTSPSKRIFEISKTTGAIITEYDVSNLPITNLSGLALGPNSVNSSHTSFYLVSRGIDSDLDPVNYNDGKLFELADPATGTTISPLEKVTTISPIGNITETMPTYTWNEIENATGYRLLVDNTVNKLFEYTLSAAEANCNGTTCSITLSDAPTTMLTPGTTYRWYTRGFSPLDSGKWSKSRSFTVATPPGQATLMSPLDTITTPTPTYTWSAVSGATDYTLVVYDAGNGTILAMNSYTAAEANCNASTCSTLAGISLSGGNYTWLVQASNAFGSGMWSIYNPSN